MFLKNALLLQKIVNNLIKNSLVSVVTIEFTVFTIFKKMR